MSDGDKITEELFAMFANTRMEATQSYLERGRPLNSESNEDLKIQWIAQLSAMADDRPEFNRQIMDDLESELGLRGIETPADQVPEVVAKLAARSKAQGAEWTSEQWERAEERLQQELEKVRSSKKTRN